MSMTMKVICEREGIEAVFRVLECGCGEERCDGHAIVAAHDRERRVWAVLGTSGPETLEEALARLMEGDLDDFVETICALVGCPFKRLLDPTQVAMAARAWEVLPDWMMRLSPAGVRELRGRVWGDDLVRVPAALLALNRAGDAAGGGVYRRGQEGVLLADLQYHLDPGSGLQG